MTTREFKKLVCGKWFKRITRLAALMLGVGLLAPGAGNWLGMDAVISAIFGGILAGIGVIAVLLLVYAGKGEVSDSAFDKAINDQIEKVKAEQDSAKK